MKVPVLSSLILLLGLSSPLTAIERPKALDQDGPKEGPSKRAAKPVQDEGPAEGLAERPQGEEPVAPPAEAKPMAWLGVLSEPIDETLSMHLDVASGVVLSYVAQDSPAAAAGLQRHDVVIKVDGRAIGNQDELRDEIQSHGPGDEVTITVISRGQQVERKVKLGERPEAPVAQPGAAPFEGLPGLNLGQLQERLPELRGRMKDFDHLLPGGGEEFQKRLDGHMKRLEKQLRELEKAGGGQLKMDFDLLDNFKDLPKPGEGKGGFNLEFKSSSTFKFFDGKGSVEMKMKDGAKEVVVRDKEGEVLFEGPWDTDQDKASAPAEIRERIERMNDGNRFHFRLENIPEPEMELPDVKKPELE